MRPASSGPVALCPPLRFAVVDAARTGTSCLYRSAYPTKRNFNFIKTLNLRTIISVVPRDLITRDLVDFCDAHDVAHLICVSSKGSNALDANPDDDVKPPPTHDIVARVLGICIDPDRMPVLLHCADGSHVTGLIVAVLRRLQLWSPEAVLKEFAMFTKRHDVSEEEKKFVMRFHSPITLPARLAPWLWDGERPARHPSIPLLATAVSAASQVVVMEDTQQQQQQQQQQRGPSGGGTAVSSPLLSSVGRPRLSPALGAVSTASTLSVDSSAAPALSGSTSALSMDTTSSFHGLNPSGYTSSPLTNRSNPSAQNLLAVTVSSPPPTAGGGPAGTTSPPSSKLDKTGAAASPPRNLRSMGSLHHDNDPSSIEPSSEVLALVWGHPIAASLAATTLATGEAAGNPKQVGGGAGSGGASVPGWGASWSWQLKALAPAQPS